MTKVVLDGVNHGFHATLPPTSKSRWPRTNTRCTSMRDIPTHAKFRVPDGEWGSAATRQGNVIDEHSYLMSFKKMYLTRFLIEQHTQWA